MHDITQGQLTDGTDVMTPHGKNLRKFRRRIGMIFQSFNLITRTTVIKNVLTAFVPGSALVAGNFWHLHEGGKDEGAGSPDQMGILDKAFVRADQPPVANSRGSPGSHPWPRILRLSWRMSRWPL